VTVEPEQSGWDLSEIAHGGLRGAIAAMAMSGMRIFTSGIGLVEETPPQAILRQRGKWLAPKVRRKRREAMLEGVHVGYGVVGGVAFALLPDPVRTRAWAGPLYGLVVWLGFELGIAPLLGLKQAGRRPLPERLALAADHSMYGFVLSETRRRPQ
jgi:uncharacterized membrane protein YagU involved in acid resistance